MVRRTNYLVVVFLVSVGILLAAVIFGGGGGGDRPVAGAGEPGNPAAAGALDPAVAGVPGGRPAVGDASEGDPSRRAVETPPAVRPSRVILHGRLLAAAGGAPVQGVELVWRARGRWGFETDFGRGPEDARAETAADGRFAIPIDARRAGSLSLDREDSLLFAGQERRRVEVAAYDADADLGDLEVFAAATVVGRVVDESGQPILAARVRANPDALVLWMPGDGQQVDDEGRFELKGLEPGTHRVGAEAAGFVPATVAVEVSLGAPDAEVELQLSRGASIAGTVVDDRGLPVAGAKVATFRNRTLGPDVEVSGLDGTGAVETDANGYFVLSGVEGRAASLRAWCKGMAPQTVADVAVGTSNATMRLQRLGQIEGQLLDTDGTAIEGSRVSARTGGRAPLTGRVLEALDFGQGVRAQTDGEGRFILEGVRPGTVALDARGPGHLPVEGFSVQLSPGATISNVTLRADIGSAVAAQVFDGDGRPVAGATVTISDPPPPRSADGPGVRRIGMRIGGGEPGPGGDFEMTAFDQPRVLRSGQTDAEGRVRLGGLPAGPVQVRAESDELAASRPVELSVPRRGTVDALLTLRAAGHVEVRSITTAGDPAPEAAFVLRGPQGASADDLVGESGTTDAAGHARVGPLLEGRYVAVLRLAPRPMSLGDGMSFVIGGSAGDELATTQVEVTVRSGETAEVVLTRPILARITGSVRDVTGPVAGAQVELRNPDAPPFAPGWSAKTDSDGAFELKDVPAGTYRLSWGKPRQLVPHEDDLVVPVGTPELVRDLEIRGGAVRVEVRSDIDDGPLARAEVSLRRPGVAQPQARGIMMVRTAITTDGEDQASASSITMGGRPSIRTGDDGIALIEDVPPGEYELVIEHRRHVDGRIEKVQVVDGRVVEAGSVTLAAAGVIRGKVTGFAEGSEMEIALVECRAVGSDDEPRREMAMQGAFEIDSLGPGDYELRAQQIGPGAGEEFGPMRRVTVRAGEPTRVELTLR